MNIIFEKIGIYDLITVLLSGIVIATLSVLIDNALLNSNFHLDNYIKIEDTFLFFIISYFIGIIFQEVSSLIYKIFTNDNKKVIENVLNRHKNSHQNLTIKEFEGIYNIVKNELNLTEPIDVHFLYNYCKFYLIANSDTTRTDKYQYVFGMSRSLSLYFIILSLIIICFCDKNWFVAIFSIVLAIIFGYRCIRFSKMRYTNVFRSFYYGYLQKSKKIFNNDEVVKKKN